MTNDAVCPKCGGEMDKGNIIANILSYASDNFPKGFFSYPFPVMAQRAQACLSCGYLELYLDPKELVSKIKG